MKKLLHDEIPRLSLDDAKRADRHPISILLENIRSVHNVGSVIRTADAIRAAEVILAGVTASGDHRGVHKSALGAQDAVPWRRCDDPLREVDNARKLGATIIALEITDDPVDLDTLSTKSFPILLVIGNEVDGISDSLLAACDFAMELPQYGMKQSLNVSVATGIALYDLLRLYLVDNS
jgi:tRNA G18 (ribose-2'-O)-methylase SpoU